MSDKKLIQDALREKVKEFPTQSGVYLMKSLQEKILYIGKAKNLRNRVRSYFLASIESPKTRLLVQHIHEIEYILTKTEVEAFLLEASLIKKHRPRYNIRLRDDKSYPYIRLTWSEKFPRLYLARKVKKDGSLYFGPYTSGGAVAGTIRFLNRTFRIRDCKDAMFRSRVRPCLTHQIGRCTAPCVKLINETDYRFEMEGAKLFLKGQNSKVIKALTQKMRDAAEEEKFEVAARLRDSIQSVKSILEKQTVVQDSSDVDQDAIGYFGDERGCLVETVHVRAGRVLGTRSHFLPHVDPQSLHEEVRDWLVDFVNQYYEDNFVPDEVLLPTDIGPDLSKLMEQVLQERSDHKVNVRYPTDNRGRGLLEMAHQNAESHFARSVSKSAEKREGLVEIQTRFQLTKIPMRIECYDISNFQGSETVASQVVFEDGVPAKDHYRRYKIKSVSGIDDYQSMKEVLTRRFGHDEWDEPDLVVIDGGKGQLGVATHILTELGKTHIPVVGLAKARTLGTFETTEVTASEERFFLPGRQNPVVFRTNTEAYQI